MQDLRVIGTEDGALLVSDDDGTRYRLPVDDVLQLKLRQVAPDPSIGQRLAPREIQSYIRSGMSAEDVASLTGAPLDHIQKFEGPVLAEREFVVNSALSVPVHTALETDPLAQGATFGSAIRSRLQDLNATGERWASWKDAETGWVVKLSFASNLIDHDARWHFDPKRLALDPINNEAVTLSQQGGATGSLLPRLHAVHQDDRSEDATRFDSGAFDLGEANPPEAESRLETTTRNQTKPLPDQAAEMNQTADLLEALRRRRGEREAASYEGDGFDEGSSTFASPASDHPSTGMMSILEAGLDIPISGTGSPRKTGPQPTARQTGGQPRVRRDRKAMPTWDEIVFGARPDDDLA
jgi:Protein of unknown function (DUF3071)